MRKTARPVVWEGAGAQSPAPDPISALRCATFGLPGLVASGIASGLKANPRTEEPKALVSGFHSRGGLPHLKREGGSYFVTFRLAGTLPKEVLCRLKRERAALIEHALAAKRPLTWPEQEELFRWYSSRVPDIAGLMAQALKFFTGVRYDLLAWVVMPNHVHAVLRPMPDWSLSRLLKCWKGYTAHVANEMLGRTGNPFWQVESFDHLIRDDEDMQRCCRYTTMNPVTAGFCAQPEDWKWSSAHRLAQ